MGINIKLTIILLIVMVGGAFLNSCDSSGKEGNYNCTDCITQKPDTASISINVTLNSQNDSVKVYIYFQDYSEGMQPDDSIVTKKQTCKYFVNSVRTNHYFSIGAVYKSGDKTIYAFDGGDCNYQEQSGCDISCWQLVGGKYDVKLKFD
jgi:hypothetical protein